MGTCVKGNTTCTSNDQCTAIDGDWCSMAQEDSDHNGVGDACDYARSTSPPTTQDSINYNLCVTFDGNFVTCAPGDRNTLITCCDGPCVFDDSGKSVVNMLPSPIHRDTSAFTMILNEDGSVGGDLIRVNENDQVCFDVNLANYYSPEVLKSATSLQCFATTYCNERDPEIDPATGQCKGSQCVKIANYTVYTDVLPISSLNLKVPIDIRPLSEKNRIYPQWSNLFGVIPVAILSNKDFSAPNKIKTDSLRFGVTGTEDSLLRILGGRIPGCVAFDVNRDGNKDLVCLFVIGKIGDIGPQTEKLIMTGGLKNVAGFTGFIASDSVEIVTLESK